MIVYLQHSSRYRKRENLIPLSLYLGNVLVSKNKLFGSSIAWSIIFQRYITDLSLSDTVILTQCDCIPVR